jgi:hypothetical protein
MCASLCGVWPKGTGERAGYSVGISARSDVPAPTREEMIGRGGLPMAPPGNRESDDGIGGADPAGGSGLCGLADRVEALGGKLELTRPAGAGTSLRAEIPTE